MSVAVAKANLMDAQKKLRAAWDRAHSQWDDGAAALFCKEIIDPIEPRIAAAIKGIDHLMELMVKARRECGDDSGGD